MKKCFVIIFSLLCIVSCTELGESSRELPKAGGNTAEILLVTDSLTWRSSIGDNIKKTLREAHPASINPEPFFKISYLPEEQFGGMFTKHHFIFIPTTLERIGLNPLFKKLIPEKITNQVKESGNYLFYKLKDVFASNQTVLFLISQEAHYQEIDFEQNRRTIQEVIEKELQLKYKTALLESDWNKNQAKYLQQTLGCNIRLPSSYVAVIQEENFHWYRSATGTADLNVFFSSKPYKGAIDFDTASILAWRNELTTKHLFLDDSLSYMLHEESVVPFVRTETDSLSYSKFVYGLWKINNRAKGGSYVSRITKSVKNDRIYYIEGFVYAPGQEKLNYIRELEAIIRTFEPGINE